jgi:YD repeat-containing protein
VTDVFNATYNALQREYSWKLPVSPSVSTPSGATIDLGGLLVNGQPRVTSKSQVAGSGCDPSTSTAVYDANGNRTTQDNFDGVRSCMAYDTTRNLETIRVEGLTSSASCATAPTANTVPAGARRINTQWHPDWPLQSKVSQPKKITTLIYNGQPDPFNANAVASCAPTSAVLPNGKPIVVLCKAVEQATTDTDGAKGFSATLDSAVPNRVVSYTYDGYGRMLTKRSPRNFTTTYAYYATNSVDASMGDLQSVTNALGKTTTFNKYNAFGMLTESTDPNGLVTKVAYDDRLRVTSSTVGQLVTAYGYEDNGLLKTATFPDGAVVTYSYDSAHRLIGIADSAGNTITYVLDANGNRVNEQVKDASGALMKKITRSFDALNRLQSVIGAAE